MAEFINTIDLLGEEATIDGIIDGSITEFYDNELSVLGVHAFSATHIESVKLPSVTYVDRNAFWSCWDLKWLEFSEQVWFGNYSLYAVNSLRTLILRSEMMCKIGVNAMPKVCYIYVPKALIEDYKADTAWSVYADQFRALEDYTVDGTITGELDESKI